MIRLPTFRLMQHVHYYVLAQLDGTLNHIPATASPILVVFRSGGTRVLGSKAGATLPAAFLAGPCLTARRSVAFSNTTFVSVILRPGEVQHFFDIDASELAGTQIALREFIGGDADQIEDRVMRASGPAAIFEAIEHFLLLRASRMERQNRRFEPLPSPDTLLGTALPMLANELGISERHLQRKFAVQYGVSLRDFKRLIRFRNSLADLLRAANLPISLSRVAHQAGYFDHAHFDRAFREMCGLTPSEFLQRMQKGDPAFWAFRFKNAELDHLFPPDNNVASVQDMSSIANYV